MMISVKIKKLIDIKRCKPAILAKHLGISPSRLSNYLSGKQEPDIETLSKMAAYLGVDLNYFSGSVIYDCPEEVIFSDCENTMPDKQTVKVPCVKINSGEHKKPDREILLDKRLIAGIDNPLFIESVHEIFPANIHKGALVMTDTYKYRDPAAELLIKRGRDYNLFKVMIIDEHYFLLNMREQKFIYPKEDERYYAVKWILQ